MINENLQYLWDNEGCVYTKTFADGTTAKLLWQCSLTNPTAKFENVIAYHYALFILGYATNFLPKNFYATYAVDAVEPTGHNELFLNAITFWNNFRDESNGLYCNAMYFTNDRKCGTEGGPTWCRTNQVGVQNCNYSIETYYGLTVTAWGIIADVMQAELGLLTSVEAKERILQVQYCF